MSSPCFVKAEWGLDFLTDKIYTVSGTLVPDVTGTYNPDGFYNNRESLVLAAGGWFIWWDGTANWKISTVKGTEGTDFWTRTDPSIEGAYTAGGTATGEATVAEA